jgi:1-acyl-sn-glycerol-3-phosphate acyltransferase
LKNDAFSRMKKLFYYFVKYTAKLASHCYFREIKIYGLETLPKKGGVLFSPNHQGAFLDPLLVGCNIPKGVTSLTRSDVFGGPLQWFLDALKMLPVYRIRNGYANLRKNDIIFEKCKKLLSENQWIMMFSEASHHSEYYLQSLSKGSSRLAYEAQEMSKDPIYIVPVGINYGDHKNPYCDLHLVFGPPIAISPYFEREEEKPAVINAIRDALRVAMKKCIWLPENDEPYLTRKQLIHRGNTRLSFRDIKKGIEDLSLTPKKSKQVKKWQKGFMGLVSIPNLPPLLVLKRILGLFEDIVFYSSIKMCAGLILFPVWWITVFLCSQLWWDWEMGILLSACCVGLLYFRQLLSNKFLS